MWSCGRWHAGQIAASISASWGTFLRICNPPFRHHIQSLVSIMVSNSKFVSVCLFSISASFSGYVQYVTVLRIRYVCACSFVSRVQKVVQDSFFTRTSCVFHHDLFFSRFCPSSEPIPRFHPRRLQFWRRSIWRPRRERTK